MLTRRTLLAAGAATLAAPALAKPPRWFDGALVIDGLSGLGDPYAPEEQTRLSDRAKAELRQSGVTALRTTLVPVGNQPDVWDEVNRFMDNHDSLFAANPDFLVKVKTAADIEAARKAGKLGVIYGTQDTAMVGTELDRLAKMRERGVRCVQLTYNLRNLSGDGALEPADAGLSRLAKATIERIEAEKLLLDFSHGGARTIREGLAMAKRPPTVSHTGCRDLFDHPRNIFDADMKTTADKGGVVGIYFMPFLVRGGKATAADVIAHIEHAWKVCGEDHVAIGTDNGPLAREITEETWKAARADHEYRSKMGFAAPGEGPDVLPLVLELNRIDRFAYLADRLAARGHGQAKLEKLFGTNWLRVYRDVWGG
ncbi:dipeptidase [Sandaracinobacter sp.]|uniref:dipeptidase n=1 Tax=Sandaracinobacter sp. TaxID=2487581 RepID=UPI0035B00A3B